MSEEMIAMAGDGNRTHKLDALLAIALGIAAIAIAWCSYESGLLGGDSLLLANRSIELSGRANHKFSEGTLQSQADESIFLEYANALDEGKDEHATYVHEHLMDSHLAKSVDWWHDQNERPGGPTTPFVKENPEYHLTAFDEADELQARSERTFREGKRLDDRGDSFDLVTVLLAISLFLFGVAALFSVRVIRYGAAGVGVLILVASIARILDLGYYAGM